MIMCVSVLYCTQRGVAVTTYPLLGQRSRKCGCCKPRRPSAPSQVDHEVTLTLLRGTTQILLGGTFTG
jgi:hypothetical protein